MLRRLKSLLQRTVRASAAGELSLNSFAELAAHRFARWASHASGQPVAISPGALPVVNDVLTRLRDSTGAEEPPASVLADGASFLGEVTRRRWPEAVWVQHPLYGPVVAGLGGVATARLLCESLLLQKWSRSAVYSLPDFFASLEKRVEEEQRRFPMKAPSPLEVSGLLQGLEGGAAAEAAAGQAELFQRHWREHGLGELPLTLRGVRQLDTFLRTHYVANFLPDGALVGSGLFVGEVGRGLYEGQWSFREVPPVERAALCWPELPYYPVGRIFKMMTEQPEAERLDDYLRLVPSARKELREKAKEGSSPSGA